MKLNAGCGRNDIRKGYINMDIRKYNGVDVVHDLNIYPYPFKDNFFDEIVCIDVIEHINSIPNCMDEFHRILKPIGLLKMRYPHYNSLNASRDLTHIHFLALDAFNRFEYADDKTYFYTFKNRYWNILSEKPKKTIFFCWLPMRLVKLLSLYINNCIDYVEIVMEKIPLENDFQKGL